MLRSLILAAIFVCEACGGVWPQNLGQYQLRSVASVNSPAADQAQPAEYGFDAAERADYGVFQVTALRFKDITGAYAASLEPSSKSGIRVGNYLVSCEGRCPKDLAELAKTGLPHVSHGALPSLIDYFASKNLVPHSERYILGPVGLAANLPEVPASAVSFDFGTEGMLAKYRTPGGPVMLAIFSFPTPSFARQQLPQFEKITGASAKRTGPLIAVAIGPSAASAKLLATVSYQGVVEENQKPPEKPLELKPESAGKMIIAILTLAGLLLLFCLLSGLAVGGALHLARKFGYSAAEGSLITLHLEGE